MTTQQPHTIATHKIIVLVVFICAAIMASLFVFHMKQKPALSILTSDVGLIFPVPRDIKPFELTTVGEQPFTQKELLGHWTLLFFGFTHCSSICPTTLAMLNRVYTNLHATYPTLQVAFISLDPDRDALKTLTTFTASFNPAFIGASGTLNELRKLQSQLGIFSGRDTTTGDSYQLQHTASILLIDPRGKWAGLFQSGMTPTQFTQVLEKSMRALT